MAEPGPLPWLYPYREDPYFTRMDRFVQGWHSYSFILLGSVGFLDRFTVTASRFSQAVAVEEREAFDNRFGVVDAG